MGNYESRGLVGRWMNLNLICILLKKFGQSLKFGPFQIFFVSCFWKLKLPPAFNLITNTNNAKILELRLRVIMKTQVNDAPWVNIQPKSLRFRTTLWNNGLTHPKSYLKGWRLPHKYKEQHCVSHKQCGIFNTPCHAQIYLENRAINRWPNIITGLWYHMEQWPNSP